MMEIHGYTGSGAIEVTIEGVRMIVPDDMANRHRRMIAESGLPIPPYVPEPDPFDPLTLSLTKRQINRALILAGHTDPDGFIEAAIATIEDATQRALALTDWRLAPYYDRTHPLLNDPAILTAAGFTPQDVDDLWSVAAQQPA